MTFSAFSIERVLAAVREKTPDTIQDERRIRVHATIRKFAFLYERIRNAVEYRDDHLLRKSAIHRIIKRLLALESDADVIAQKLVYELVSARYMPDDELAESILSHVADRIRKYQAVATVNTDLRRHLSWLQGVLAVELEELLVDHTEKKALTTFLFERIEDHVHVHGVELSETERRIQLYVACERALWKADDDMLSYKLLRAYLPEWLAPDEWMNDPRPIAERLVALEIRIRRRLSHPLHQRFLHAVRPWAVSLHMLRDVLRETKEGDREALFQSPEALDRRITHKAEDTYRKASSRLRRGTVRAMVYLFFTKMVFALLLEIPLETAFEGGVRFWALGTNLVFPPVLMFFVGLLIRVPGKPNTERLVRGVHELLQEEDVPLSEIILKKKKSASRRAVFTLVYAATFGLTFGLLIWTLNELRFTVFSIAIFLFFLSVVSFFAFRLRRTAREVEVVERKQGTISVLVDFFTLPILRAGQWFSRSISRINVFLFIFDFMVEAPFKLFLAVLEEWFAFMKEKKEELE